MHHAIRNTSLLVLTALVLTVFPIKNSTESAASEMVRMQRASWDTQGLEEQRQELTALLAIRERTLGVEQARQLAGPLAVVANKYGWDPLMILAVMEIESNLRPTVESYAGAVGLMQLIPYVAESQAGEAGVFYGGTDALRESATNLELGVRYLTELRAKYDGRPDLYLTAYNLGPTRLDKRLNGRGQHWFTYANKILNRYERLRRQMVEVRAQRDRLFGSNYAG